MKAPYLENAQAHCFDKENLSNDYFMEFGQEVNTELKL